MISNFIRYSFLTYACIFGLSAVTLKAGLTPEEQLTRAQHRLIIPKTGCRWKPSLGDFLSHWWLAGYAATGGYIYTCKWSGCYFYGEVVTYVVEYEPYNFDGIVYYIPIMYIEVIPANSWRYDCWKYPDIVLGSCETPNICSSMPYWSGP